MCVVLYVFVVVVYIVVVSRRVSRRRVGTGSVKVMKWY